MRKFLFRAIGVLEVAGGFYGATSLLYRLWQSGSGGNLAHSLLGLALFGFVLIAGVMLLEGSERGIALSRWAQLLQLPLLATPAFSYAMHSGAYIDGFASLQAAPRLALEWRFGTQGFVLALAGPGLSRVGINLLALACWLMLRGRRA